MNTKIIQISSGKGPVECCWVVAQVLKLFIEALKGANIKYTLLDSVPGVENRTLQSATLQLQGEALEAFLKVWLGTIQWIGQSSFRKFHKRKNWFIGIYEIKAQAEIALKEKEISFQAIRSSGPGGQHVNKVSSAIRATHKQTGLQVLVMDSRSQHQNKKNAIKRLQDKVAAYNQEQLKVTVQAQWQNHLHVERGNPTRVFTGSDFKTKNTTKSYKKKRQALKHKLKQDSWD